MAEQKVTLNPGESKLVNFEAVPSVAKTYQVSVNGLAGSFVAREAPAAEFAYISDIRYSPFTVPPLPGWNPEYSCGSRSDYQAFEVDIQNQGEVAGECVLGCYIRHREAISAAPWSSWSPDTNFECRLWCREPYRCCFSAGPYRVKRAVIQPGEVVTFRGICWHHFFDDQAEDQYIQARFVGDPGEIISKEVKVEPYA
ncbi:unnamed protein product [marine sediment metagenome]|uniref:Uncharacterized protein n=1 Tax=marine sediment metagenome TaxID=412755 RepID=X1IT72_9ZZZZ